MVLKKPDLDKPAFKLFPDFSLDVVLNKCPFCKKEIKEEDFPDELSKKEYSVSGLCATCQDLQFGKF
jgi:hypothetical protein